LQPRSLEVLEDLGIVDEVLANGRFHLPFRGYDGPTVLGDLTSMKAASPHPMCLTQAFSSFPNGGSKKY
jgi:hypothetical protein